MSKVNNKKIFCFIYFQLLGSQKFSFHVKHHFPKKLTLEFLLVDLVNNLQKLAEDQDEILKNISSKVQTMNTKRLKDAVLEFGNAKAKKILLPLMNRKALAAKSKILDSFFPNPSIKLGSYF